jgi:hypothetical protein
MDSEIDDIDDNRLENKNYFIELVKRRDNRLSFVRQLGKSEVWNRFERIYYERNETNFVKCKHCNDVKKQNRFIGTAGLLRHKCRQFIDFCREEESIKPQINLQFNENEVKFSLSNDQIISNNNNNNNNESFDELLVNNESILKQEFSFNDRNFLISLVESNDQRLSFEPQSGKSEVWTRFERIFYDNLETLYVKCKYCNDIQKQTRNIGTGSLLRHRCKAFSDKCSNDELQESSDQEFRFRSNKNNNNKNFIKKCETVDEKIRFENKTLKDIIKKCLETIDKCLCIERTIVSDKEQINVLINNYNEWLRVNEDSDESDVDESDDNYNSSEEKTSLKEIDFKKNSDNDSNYKPLSERKPKIVVKSVNNRRVIFKPNTNPMIGSNYKKSIYNKRAPKVIDPNVTYACDRTECGKVFKNKHLLRKHSFIHSGHKPYKCLWPGCDAAFLKKTDYDLHTCTHTNEKKFKCDWPECTYKTCRKNVSVFYSIHL